jgi:hypothetical protein
MTTAPTETDTVPLVEPTGPEDGEMAHGYPPPIRPAGTAVTAYCGVRMIVRGELTKLPPEDTCPICAQIWRSRKAGAR